MISGQLYQYMSVFVTLCPLKKYPIKLEFRNEKHAHH